jgi:hypothetical protein
MKYPFLVPIAVLAVTVSLEAQKAPAPPRYYTEQERAQREGQLARQAQEPGYQNFEYACHEGNYAMFDSLSGARAQERAAAEAAKKK